MQRQQRCPGPGTIRGQRSSPRPTSGRPDLGLIGLRPHRHVSEGPAGRRCAVRTFLTDSRRASGARVCGRRRAGHAAWRPFRARRRTAGPTRSIREPWSVSSPVAAGPTRHCSPDSGARQGRFASLRDGLRPPWTRPLRRATCSAVGSPARSGQPGSDSCTPRVPPTLQRRHPDQTNHDPAEHVTTGDESPGGLRNEKVRGSNPLSSTRRQPRPTSVNVAGRAGFRHGHRFPTSVRVPPGVQAVQTGAIGGVPRHAGRGSWSRSTRAHPGLHGAGVPAPR